MSYKSRRQKNTLRNRIQYRMRKFRIVLSRPAQNVRSQLKGRKEYDMFLPQTRKVMAFLRDEARRIRPNNKKIAVWVDAYINECALRGENVQILTQWCLSKDLEIRRQKQGGKLQPLETERKLLQESVPSILKLFEKSSVHVDWWFTFNQSFLDDGRVDASLAGEYFTMIRDIITDTPPLSQSVVLLDWEKDILGARPEPNRDVMENFSELVAPEAFRIDMKNLMRRARQYGVVVDEDRLRERVKFKIACEAEEGRFLVGKASPFPDGRFILIPLEFPECYVFFETLAPSFSERVVALAKPYPWRMDTDDLVYEP